MRRLIDRPLRVILTAAHSAMKVGWFVRRPRTFGAHALALTPDRKIVLVKLRYAPGWRVPGGGRDEREDPVPAVLRELREEIGLVSHGSAEPVREFEESTDFKRDLSSVVVVRDARYRPHRWSWEVERIGEFALDALPPDISAVTARWVEAVRPHI